MSEQQFPKGFYACGINCGIKKDGLDLAVIYSDTPAAAAGVYTNNLLMASPLQVTKEHLEAGHTAQAVVINSGVANAAMGQVGYEDASYCTDILAATYNIPPNSTIVASTGVIGIRLPLEKIVEGIKYSKQQIKALSESAADASHAIMTTDTVPKTASFEFTVDGKPVKIWGMCKGAGMIHPNMSTMLGFVLCDGDIEAAALQSALHAAIMDSFNMISVDGDTSTNDMVVVLANGQAQNKTITMESKDYPTFAHALREVCISLACQIVSDGEGSTRMFTVNVTGAPSQKDARIIARSVASSSLVKAAMFGKDANWGRIACAAGYSGANFDPSKVDISIGDVVMSKNGQGEVFDEDKALTYLNKDNVPIYIEMHQGNNSATAWGCDLTYDYVKINADYRS